MNFVAHSHVALLCVEGGFEEAFGAALPDLASMAGARIDRSKVPARVVAGVELHHLADSAFHGLQRFRLGSGQIRQELQDAGIPTGAARAVGHAGYELLLDGCLLERPQVGEDFAHVMTAAPDVSAALVSVDPSRWRWLLARMREDRWWLGYEQPLMIAGSLYRRLASRRLLRFEESKLETVASVLAGTRPLVDEAVEEIIVAVTQALRGALAIGSGRESA